MDLIEQGLRIDERIYSVRGRQVMIDRDLAELYGVETKQLNRAVKRNIERFPDDFMFQLTKDECLRCQIGTLNIKHGQYYHFKRFRELLPVRISICRMAISLSLASLSD